MREHKTFGRYQIIKHLATGGMAEVLLATATGIEGFSRHIVIKQIDPQYSQSPTFVQMFLDEARLAASLHHHNIIQVHDIGKEGSTYFFTMEYVHGEDLRKLLTTISARKEKTPLEHTLTIITAAASALHYAHEKCGPDRRPLNLVHRDVSPSNIMIAFDGNVKVADFGIAKTAMATTETRAGDIKGKFSHMSPEQCLGKPLDRRSDVFALGIVLYEMVTVRPLFRGEGDFEKMKQIVEGTIDPPSKYRLGLPPELDRIILKALARDAAERYQTADELRVALERFAILNNLRSSTTALADYMKQLFGERPEPWSVVEDPPDAHTAVTRAIAKIAAPLSTSSPQEANTEGTADMGDNVAKQGDSWTSKTPMAWSAVQEQPSARKRRLPLLAAVLAVPLAMGLMLARASSDSESAPASAAQPTAAPRRTATSPAFEVARTTQPGTAAPGATLTATAGSEVATNTQPGTAAPSATPASIAVAVGNSAPTSPPAAAAAPAISASVPSQLPRATVEPSIHKPTARSAKRVAAPKLPTKPAWDPDALTPE